MNNSTDIEDVLYSYQDLVNTCIYGKSLSSTNACGIEFFATEYCPTDSEYSVGIEGFISDTFKTIYEFFKRLVVSVKDFIYKLFNMIFSVSRTNETNIHKLRDLFHKRNGELNSIAANPSIPEHRHLDKVFYSARDLTQTLINFDLNKLKAYIADAFDGKVSPDKFPMSFQDIVGKDYTTLFSTVGLIVETDNHLSFQTVFINSDTNNTIGGLGYNYDELKKTHQVLAKYIGPLKQRLDVMVSVLQKITDSISKLKAQVTDGNAIEDKHKYILEVLPKEISSVIGLYQKTGFMILTYEMKFSEILKNLYSDLK